MGTDENERNPRKSMITRENSPLYMRQRVFVRESWLCTVCVSADMEAVGGGIGLESVSVYFATVELLFSVFTAV